MGEQKKPAAVAAAFAGYSTNPGNESNVHFEACQEVSHGIDVGKAGGARRADRPAKSRVPAAFKLVSEVNNWEFENVYLSDSGCGCGTCPRCSRQLLQNVRKHLLEPDRLALFKKPQMMTFHIDTKRFSGPEEAFDYVTDNAYIKEFMKAFGIRHWFKVLEFHKSGWPHWHVLIDVSEKAFNPEDLKRGHRLWQAKGKWGIGGFHISKRPDEFKNREHAVFYVTKYLADDGKHPVPLYILKRKMVRRFSASRSLGRLRMAEDNGNENLIPRGRKREVRTYLERQAACGTSSKVIRKWVDKSSGEVRYEFLDNVAAGKEALLSLSNAGQLPGVRLVEKEELHLGYTVKRICFESADGKAVNPDVEDINKKLGNLGYFDSHSRLAQSRKNYYFWCDKVLFEDVPDAVRTSRLAVAGAYMRILSAGVANGWIVRKKGVFSKGGSAYLRFRKEGFGKLLVRISNHKWRGFSANNKYVFNVRVDRDNGLFDKVLEVLRSGGSGGVCGVV